VTKKLFKKIKPEKLSHTHQKSIHKELELSDWPPVGQVTYSEEDVEIMDRQTLGLSVNSNSIN
jgi:hypothetical protein